VKILPVKVIVIAFLCILVLGTEIWLRDDADLNYVFPYLLMTLFGIVWYKRSSRVIVYFGASMAVITGLLLGIFVAMGLALSMGLGIIFGYAALMPPFSPSVSACRLLEVDRNLALPRQ